MYRSIALGPFSNSLWTLSIARDRFWNLSKTWSGLSHHYINLRNGFKFHYVSNELPGGSAPDKPLVIFIHGFPDSWAVWRYLLRSKALQEAATLVAVDLPGYGGTDSLEKYSSTNVLESLAEFIIAIRAKYGVDTDAGTRQRRTVIVSHDWGCVLSMRLAAEAPQLADRFILSNGPLVCIFDEGWYSYYDVNLTCRLAWLPRTFVDRFLRR